MIVYHDYTPKRWSKRNDSAANGTEMDATTGAEWYHGHHMILTADCNV